VTYSDISSKSIPTLAVSSVVQKPVQTFWPLCVSPGAQSPFTKFDTGTGNTSTSQLLYILWTVCAYSGVTNASVQINHFVPLIAHRDDADYITIHDIDEPLPCDVTGFVKNDAENDTDSRDVVCLTDLDEVGNYVACSGVSTILRDAHGSLVIRQVLVLITGDLKHALYGQGDFQLTPLFKNHNVPYVKWEWCTEERRDQLFAIFMADGGIRLTPTNNVTSSDGLFTVQGTNNIARKPN